MCATAFKQCPSQTFRGRTAQEPRHTVSATRPIPGLPSRRVDAEPQQRHSVAMARKKAVSKKAETPSAPTAVVDLVARFREHADAYHAGRYNETQIRREFIDPFFKTLGWDVWNEQGYAEAYKDVIHEDAINVGGVTKAPDYCFRIGGVRKFFVEAKKPSVDIKADAWSAKLPLSILTDFEELAVYDCRIGPTRRQRPISGSPAVDRRLFGSYPNDVSIPERASS